LFLVPFSLMFLGFFAFWEYKAMSDANPSIFMRLWGVPFLLFGLYAVVGRFVADAWARRRITYALTDKRILIQRTGPFAKFTAMTFDQLPSMELIERGGGRGTIRFGQDQQTLSNWGYAGHGGWSPAFDPIPQFIAIENARRVSEQIQIHLAKRD
jgi:hypothetical protein